MAQAIESYLDDGRSERFLLPILDYWRDTPLRKITGPAVRRSAKKLYPSVSDATLNRQVIKPTRAVMNSAADLWGIGKISIAPFPERTNIERRPVTLAWVRAFDSQSRKDGLPHLGAIAVYMYGTGCRIGEAVDLTWADLDLDNRIATRRSRIRLRWARERFESLAKRLQSRRDRAAYGA